MVSVAPTGQKYLAAEITLKLFEDQKKDAEPAPALAPTVDASSSGPRSAISRLAAQLMDLKAGEAAADGELLNSDGFRSGDGEAVLEHFSQYLAPGADTKKLAAEFRAEYEKQTSGELGVSATAGDATFNALFEVITNNRSSFTSEPFTIRMTWSGGVTGEATF